MKLLPAWTRSESKPEPGAVATPQLEPIRFVTRDRDLRGWVEPRSERLSDLLQTGAPIWFLPVEAPERSWVPLDPADLLLVVPPPQVSAPGRRVRRQLHEVLVRVDRFFVAGTAHLMPGEEYNPYLRSTRQFLPLTDVTLEGVDGRSHLEVVIVNLKQVDEFRVV